MLKMVITQVPQILKTFYQYFIKKLFNLNFKLIIILIFFSSLNYSYAAKKNLDEIYCDVAKFELFKNKLNYISSKDKNFLNLVSSLGNELQTKNFNLLVYFGSKPSSGYSIELNKIKERKNKINLYFKEIKPTKNSNNLSVITHPYCLIKISNIENYKINIRKKKSKFFPFSVFN
tara:strand:+ start:2802 stop:3326 length:525 start_codon:yes stop_codon:yes gene_type:complete